jgi:hypothetical protein
MEIVAPKRHKGKRWNLLKTGDNGDTTGRENQHKKYFYKIFLCDSYIYLFIHD